MIMRVKIGYEKKETDVYLCYREKDEVIFFNKDKIKDIKKELYKVIKLYNFTGKREETLFSHINDKKVLVYGMEKEHSNEELRKAFSNILRLLKKNKLESVNIIPPNENEQEIKSIIEGLELTDYKFDKYMKKKEEEKEIKINLDIDKKYSNLVKDTLVVCQNVKITRDLVNENASVITPVKLEEIVKEFSKKYKLKTKILDEKKIQKENLNLLWEVGKGSSNPPRLIIAEYIGNPKSKEKIALVGKGITFDTGGTNLKPSGFVETMRMDMGGAATVFGTFKSAVELGLKKNLILVIPAAENCVSSNSYKPGDVFVSYSGKSVEIGNTDAEGRLVLADGISYVQKNFKPIEIIDMATLTGACPIALGPSLIAVMGNDENIKKKIFESGEETFDRVWELPIYDEHREMIKSKIADLKNVGGREGGTITAGAFLESFVEEGIKWTHLDIAGAAWFKAEKFYVPANATGIGVRLLIDYLRK